MKREAEGYFEKSLPFNKIMQHDKSAQINLDSQLSHSWISSSVLFVFQEHQLPPLGKRGRRTNCRFGTAQSEGLTEVNKFKVFCHVSS
jgi:hypothetical protein